jgi:hypothetical protein
MDKEHYISEIQKRLLKHFSVSRNGYKIPAKERHRLEGFTQGAIFMGFASSQQVVALMESLHCSVFDKTIAERSAENSAQWQDEAIDYSKYEQPTYERRKL